MKTNRTKSLLMGALLMGALAFTTGGCQSENSESGSSTPTYENPASEQAKVSFNFDLTSIKKQELGRTPQATENFFGNLVAKDISSGVEKTQKWLISMDDENWSVTSKTTMILPPGDYQFSMEFTGGNQQFVGTTNDTIQDGTNDIKMTIRPVIGTTVTDVIVVDRLPYFKFEYKELNLTQMTQPQLEVEIDGKNEGLFALDKQSGKTGQYLNITPGQHTIKLKLYDGNRYVGKSVSGQETKNIVAGTPVTINLQPLHGETTFTLTTDGGNADFEFWIPAEVVNEAGGKENLNAKFTMTSPKNAPTKVVDLEIGDISGDAYKATIKAANQDQFAKIYYDQVTLTLDFTDTRETGDNAILGSCNSTVTLTQQGESVECELTLRKRAIAGGQLLSVIGVNVYGPNDTEVAGAVVKDQTGKILGTTGTVAPGTATFGTDGYLKFLLPAGDHTVQATKGSLYGTVDISTDVFEVKNYDIFLKNSFKSCKEIKASDPSADNGTYTIDPDGPEGANAAYDVYCDMQTDGGGWTLTATFANDNQDYWTWNNRANLWNGNEHGTLATAMSNDFQSKSWKEVKGDDILFKATDVKYLIYSTMITNNTVASTQFAELKNSAEFSPSKKVGTWWSDDCGDGLEMSTSHEDTDGGGWKDNSGKGFIWRSTNNNGCNYDDTYGGIMNSYPTISEREHNWTAISEDGTKRFFYYQNFRNSPLKVFVR